MQQRWKSKKKGTLPTAVLALLPPATATPLFGGSPSMQPTRGQDVAIDAQGNIILIGNFTKSIDLGGGTLTSNGANDLLKSQSMGQATSY